MPNKLFKFFVILGRIGVYVMPFQLLGFAVLVWIKFTFIAPVDPNAKESIKFSVPPGATLEQIAKDLEANKIIRSKFGFKWLAEKKKGSTITAGDYNISPAKRPSEVVDILFAGTTINYQVKILGCQKLDEVVKSIAQLGLATGKEALSAFKNPKLMTELGIPAYVPEGYLLEGAYDFNKPIASEEIVRKIINKSKSELDGKLSGWQDRSSQLGYRPYEMIVLASLVEKESSADPSRMSAVSAVYHNRLRIGMQLQSEESLKYGIPTIKSAVADTDKAEETPYNTFTNIGLPPTPICSPTIAALKAALYPADSEALYFLRKKDGSFDYSTSFKEHQTKIDAQKGK